MAAATLVCGCFSLLPGAPVEAWAAVAKSASAAKAATAKGSVAGRVPAHKAPMRSLTLGRASTKDGRSERKTRAGKASRRTAEGDAPEAAASFGLADVADTDHLGLHGQASFYGRKFHGRKTSTGERFDAAEFTAASNLFPLGSTVAVRRMDNGRCVIVRINDRMHARHRSRVIDVSRGVAEYLGMIQAGVVFVRVAAVKPSAVAEHGVSACHAAFEPEVEPMPETKSPKLPPLLE